MWEKGNRYCYRLRPSTYMQAAMLIDDAAKLKAKRWVTVAPNYEYGTSTVKWFKQLLAGEAPDVEFVGEQWPALGKIDAGATVAALAQAKPDAILNVTFGPDLTNFVRQGNTRGLFEGRGVVSVLTGEPEYLDPLGDETPERLDRHRLSRRQRHRPRQQGVHRRPTRRSSTKLPAMGSVVGYALITAIVAGIAKTGSVDTEKMADGFGGAELRHAVRKSHVARDRPPVHARHLCRQNRTEERQRHDGRLALRRRRLGAAERRRGAEDAAGLNLTASRSSRTVVTIQAARRASPEA